MTHIFRRLSLISTIQWALIILMSCCTDFLEPKSSNEFVPKDAQALNEMLLGEAYPRRDITGINTFLGTLDDDVAAAPYQAPALTLDPNRYFAPYTWQGDIYELMNNAGYTESATNMYAQYYSLIKGANAALDYVDDVNDTPQNKDYIKAQGHALRAFYNLMLVNIYATPYNADPQALGIPIKRTSGIESNDIVRNTLQECYDFIESDLLEAARLYEGLPELMQWKADYRTNLPMVQTLLSRMYLYQERWSEASKYAEAVMKDKRFALHDLNNIPTVQNNVLIYTNYHSHTSSTEAIWLYGNMDDMTMLLADNRKDADGRAIHPYFRASDELMNTFEPGDLRQARYIVRSWFMMTDAQGHRDFMPQALGKVNVSVNSSYGTNVQFAPSNANSTIFGRSIRLSEAYLNYIEAETMMAIAGQGDMHRTNALNALNTLRLRRFTPSDYKVVDITDTQQLLDIVKDERRRELCFEGHRWFDLRRWGMPEIKHVWYPAEGVATVYTLKQGDPSYTLPLPNQSIELNPSLKQNALPAIPRAGESLK